MGLSPIVATSVSLDFGEHDAKNSAVVQTVAVHRAFRGDTPCERIERIAFLSEYTVDRLLGQWPGIKNISKMRQRINKCPILCPFWE